MSDNHDIRVLFLGDGKWSRDLQLSRGRRQDFNNHHNCYWHLSKGRSKTIQVCSNDITRSLPFAWEQQYRSYWFKRLKVSWGPDWSRNRKVPCGHFSLRCKQLRHYQAASNLLATQNREDKWQSTYNYVRQQNWPQEFPTRRVRKSTHSQLHWV